MQRIKKFAILLALFASTSVAIATPVPGRQTAEALPSFAAQGDNPHAQQRFAAPQSNFRHNFSNVSGFNQCMYFKRYNRSARARCRRLILVMQHPAMSPSLEIAAGSAERLFD